MLRSQALETPQLGFRELNGRKSCWTWPGSAPKPPRPSPEPSPEPCWTWPGSAPKPPGTFFGTFSGTFSATPVEPNLALHQSLPHLLQNLLRNPVEPDPALAPKPPRPSPEPLEPSPQPRWTWPGACTSARRSYSGLHTPLACAVGEKHEKLFIKNYRVFNHGFNMLNLLYLADLATQLQTMGEPLQDASEFLLWFPMFENHDKRFCMAIPLTVQECHVFVLLSRCIVARVSFVIAK